MPNAKIKLLIVDDDASIRTSLRHIFTESGNSVRCAEDGFSALLDIRHETPDILLSDLNMPGMSGFELLSVVRRRFPMIRVIAMSSAFSGDDIPPGISADAFYEKATGLRPLLQMMDAMAHPTRTPVRPGALAPIWIPKNGHDPSGEEYVTIACPECLRTFAQILSKVLSVVHKTDCVHCSSPIHYAIDHPMNLPPRQPVQKVGSGSVNGLQQVQ